MRTIEQMVQSEVLCCMSSMVATLAQGYGSTVANRQGNELGSLCEQAFELSAPVLDYEGAAIEAGWELSGSTWSHEDREDAETSAENACYSSGIEPHDREVYEHWAVSSWFAAKLEAAGEKVDTDFAGLCIWARTTTGQAIYADHVIERIYAATHYDEPERITAYLPEGCKRWRVGYGPTMDIDTADTEERANDIADHWRKLATGPEADAIRAAH